ncbi:hypothetical protein [Mycobacterium uberis]|nr:hypothetical protein [Mycobacterium uberis]
MSEEIHRYVALSCWTYRFYLGARSSPTDFDYTTEGESDAVAAQA